MPFSFPAHTWIFEHDTLISKMIAICFDKGVEKKVLLRLTLDELNRYFRLGMDKTHPVSFVVAVAICTAFRSDMLERYPLLFERNQTPWKEINEVGWSLCQYLKDNDPDFKDMNLSEIIFHLHCYCAPLQDTNVGPEIYALLTSTPD